MYTFLDFKISILERKNSFATDKLENVDLEMVHSEIGVEERNNSALSYWSFWQD